MGKALKVSYLLCFGLALLLGGAFFAYTSMVGDYSVLSSYGGAVWVFLLSLIVALPAITPMIKRRFRGQGAPKDRKEVSL